VEKESKEMWAKTESLAKGSVSIRPREDDHDFPIEVRTYVVSPFPGPLAFLARILHIEGADEPSASTQANEGP
jgi:hypothetical protein